jgi:excisionase family DNA binding protein
MDKVWRPWTSLRFGNGWPHDRVHVLPRALTVPIPSQQKGRGHVASSRPLHGMNRTITTRAALVDIAAVADRLGVSVRHVRRLVAERRIPFIKWGHLLRFDMDDVERWIEDARVTSFVDGHGR